MKVTIETTPEEITDAELYGFGLLAGQRARNATEEELATVPGVVALHRELAQAVLRELERRGADLDELGRQARAAVREEGPGWN